MDGSGARFGKGLGRVLGGVWKLWGPLRQFVGVIFACLYLEWSSKGLLEASGLDFGWISMGLGGILGGFWEGFLRILGDSVLFWATLWVFPCFCLLLLAFASFCCAFRSIAAQVLCFLGSFFDFLTHLQPSCIFVVIFGDLSSIFGGLGRVLGRILGGFFDEFLLDFRKRRFCKN